MIHTTTRTQSKPLERRKATRHAGSLQISWRLLGNRHMRFGEAALKDLGTTGLALQVDTSCPKGTVVIVQFEGAKEPFAEPMLLRAEWSKMLQPTKSEAPTYLVGCSFTTPLREQELNALLAWAKEAAATRAKPNDLSAKTLARGDLFLGGQRER